jgi:CBS domain-containing protein
VDTSEISHRVADFLKRHPPFSAIDEPDLLALAARGRVRFHEPHEYVLWQGEPHRHQVFVIQQGTVSLWEDGGGRSALRDVRGAGDMLGLERYNGAAGCLYSARSESDVVIYAFPEDDFSAIVLKNPGAAQYVQADARVVPDELGPANGREPHRTLLRSIVRQDPFSICRTTDTVAEVALRLLSDGAGGAIAVLTNDDRVTAVLTAESFLGWAASGGGSADEQTIGDLVHAPLPVVAQDASVSDGVLAMSGAGAAAIAITADGTAVGAVRALVTRSDLSRFFGEQPADLLRDIKRSRTDGELRELNQRVRALTLDYLTGPAAVDWLARFTCEADAAIVSRVLASVADHRVGCWCFYGSSGRGESLTRVAPAVLVLVSDDEDVAAARDQFRRLMLRLDECGYLPCPPAFDAAFCVATAGEWKERYRAWVRDPIIREMYRARALFDLRAVYGRRELFDEVMAAVDDVVDGDFLHVLANDCLANVPPLTFYEASVVDSAGERFSTFQLEESALRPLVDVARVFGMAGGAVFGRSTLERFAVASTRSPDRNRIFSDAIDAIRVVLWQQGRVGIGQGTSGAELSPALLGRRDRIMLRNGFRSILHLLQFTADREWLRQA